MISLPIPIRNHVVHVGGDTGGVTKGIVLGGAGLTGLALLAFLFLDPLLAAFLGIFGVVLLVIGWLMRDWDEHPSFEERELERARRRAVKRERTQGARDRDRARWKAHQAKQAGKGER